MPLGETFRKRQCGFIQRIGHRREDSKNYRFFSVATDGAPLGETFRKRESVDGAPLGETFRERDVINNLL